MAANTFSIQLQALRKERGMTQEQLASQLGVSAQAVSKWEKNGSYPDGDLLPRIADIFGVSIDYLYGRAPRNHSMEQQLEDSLREYLKQHCEDATFRGELLIEKIQDCIWAMHHACFERTTVSPERPRMEADPLAAGFTYVSSMAGFSYGRLNQDLEYNVVAKTPENGFAKGLESPENLAQLFAFLGDVEHMKLIYFLLSLRGTEFVREETLVKRLGMPVERIRKAMKYLLTLAGERGILECEIVDDQDKQETIYSMLAMTNDLLLTLFMVGTTLIQRVGTFHLNSQFMPGSRINREELTFLR